MVMVCPEIKRVNKDGSPWGHGDGFYLHSTLKENLDYEHLRIEKRWDCVGVMTGEEGAGKTSFGKAICYYMASLSGIKFTVDDIFFTNEQFEEWLNKAPPGAAGLWDEFILMGLSTDALLQIQNTLIKKMTMIRKKRLFILLVIPHIFMLRKYFAIARTRFCINVTSPDNLTRGTFDYYSKPTKRHLYILGYKFWEYNVWSPDFPGDFSDYEGFLVDEVAYEKKKDEATKSLDKNSQTNKDKWYHRFCGMLINMKRGGLTYDHIGIMTNLANNEVQRIMKEYQENNKDFKPAYNDDKLNLVANGMTPRVDYIGNKDNTLPMPLLKIEGTTHADREKRRLR